MEVRQLYGSSGCNNIEASTNLRSLVKKGSTAGGLNKIPGFLYSIPLVQLQQHLVVMKFSRKLTFNAVFLR